MSCDAPNRRRQLRILDLLTYTSVVALGLGAFGHAVKHSVSTFPQLMMLLLGWFTLGGCVGAFLTWLVGGKKLNVVDGFVLGVIFSGPLTLLLIQFGV